jgi:RimJ/RimL family protein N-acetyltransferase
VSGAAAAPAAGPAGLVLRTPRLLLREFGPDDVDDLFAMDGDAEVTRYLGSGVPPRTREQCAEAIGRMVAGYRAREGYGLLHASRRDDGTFVGGCGVFPVPEGDDVEIAYRVPRAQWGRGYATEMARAVLAHAFGTLRLPRVVALTWPENVASQRVIAHLGMRDAGTAFHYGRTMRLFVAEVTPQ